MTTTCGYACYIRLRTKPGKREEFLGLVRELRVNVKKHELGCVFFELLQGSEPNEFVFFEGFVDEAAREVHASAPYHLAMADAGWACLDGDPIIEFMNPAV
ncbi:MAG: putative quinol monooxygenase [Pseudomonadota bacterium]